VLDDLDAGAGGPAPAIHYPSHAPLLRPARFDARLRIDGIVVPAARAPENLRPALHLAAALESPVVVMCSQAAHGERVTEEVRAVPGVSCVIVDLAAGPGTGIPSFTTSGYHRAQVGAYGDLSRKRNLGLLIARLVGWNRILFLDDDISGLHPRQIETAAAGLDHHAVVGMPARDYPDNSVVCHASRTAGAEQDVFVSGSALAIRAQAVESFFPEVYNEDWLFLAPYLDRREVAAVGSVIQQPYDPFEFPYRAAAQEFGDVLGEGLIGYLHTAPLRPAPGRDYWAAFLDARAAFLADTYEACAAAAPRAEAVGRTLRAVRIAELTLAQITPDEMVAYVEAWIDDLATWQRVVEDLPDPDDLDAALRHLNLTSTTVTSAPRAGPPAPRDRSPRSLRDPALFRQACGE
jgi:hypothetical protein